MKKIIFAFIVATALIACDNKDKKADSKTTTSTTTNEPVLLNTDEYTHEKAGDVNFYYKNVSPIESKTINDYVVSSGLFSGGAAELYITMEGNRHIFRFPITNAALNDTAYMSKLEVAAKAIKENLFFSAPYSFYATNEKYHTLKAFEY